MMTNRSVEITVLFNNVAQDPAVQTAWGFSCLIEGLSQTVLFDTGGDGHILLGNMACLGKDPAAIDIIMISHKHWDHLGGLFTFLRQARKGVDIYFPKAVTARFREHAALLGAKPHVVDEAPAEILDGLLSIGQMGGPDLVEDRREQSIVLRGANGSVLITGCAHPGIVAIARRAREVGRAPLHMVLGGFHLLDTEEPALSGVIGELKDLGIEYLGASHCTGAKQMNAFRAMWGDRFVDFGAGGRIRVDVV
jgi:7,8-dihydropterin-6-yl-methyl-4-(beta-D-ribofuranosyl)aminobenzene 5'-phosphate synthase